MAGFDNMFLLGINTLLIIAAIGDWTNWFNEMLASHWVKLVFLAAGALLSFAWRYYRDRYSWMKRQGIETLHLSSNTIEYRKSQVERTDGDGNKIMETVQQPWLILDGIFEDDINNKVSNRYVRRLIRLAVAQTTIEQPFLRFGTSDDDHWFVMNMIRMGIAEIKGGDSLEKLAGHPIPLVSDVRCVFAVTYERWPGMRQGKTRIMLACEDDIQQEKFSQDFEYEDPHHEDRPKTMQQMSADYNGEKRYTMMLRLPVRCHSS